MKLSRRIKDIVLDPKRNFQERVFILLTFVAVSMALVALLGDIVYGEYLYEILVLTATVILIPFASILAIRLGVVEHAARVIALVMTFFILPAVFFFGGGMDGGAIPWLVFGYLYLGLVLFGRWRIIMIILYSLMMVTALSVGYTHPEFVVPHSRELFYLDTMMGILEVGMACVVMTAFQRLLFIQENNRVREETRKVEEMNRSQNRFFSSMSHELRTPINSILGLNEIIIRQENASEEIIRDAQNIQGAGRMLLALVNDILDFSRIEAGKMDIVPVNYSFSDMVAEIVSMMWLPAQEKGLDLRIEVDPSIPAELFGDEVRIKQILVNLLNNAVKYTQRGSVTLHIEKEEIREDRILLMYSVIDTGSGIKQDAIPYLFDAFRRVDEENTAKIEGTGLGLSIVKQLVELMDGRITVNSVYTQGSTFMVTMWQKISRADAVGEIDIRTPGSMPGREGYRASFTAPDARILIVDDNEMNLEVEKRLLADTGITTDTASGGEMALSMTSSVRYDMIFMDHLMSGMDGIECLRQIRNQAEGLNNHVPILVLTANAGSENRELYANSGFDGYLVKPVSGSQLEESLLAHLPISKVNRREGAETTALRMHTSGSYNRKIPLLITTSTSAELPSGVLDPLGIDVIPFTIHVDDRNYYDTIECNTEELMRYGRAGMTLSAEAPSVREFEDFFGQELKKAHNVLYITVSSAIVPEYDRATAAARAYGNVLIYDSRSSSASVGLLALFAHHLSTQGIAPERIVEELDRFRDRIRSSFVADGSYFAQLPNRREAGVFNLMQLLNIHPIIGIRNKKYRMERIAVGEMDRCHERLIDHALPVYVNPDPDLLIVVYVTLDDAQRSRIETLIRRRCRFRSVIFIKACGALAMNCGPGSIGLVYCLRDLQEMRLGRLFGATLSGEQERGTAAAEEGGQAETQEVLTEEEEPVKRPWYMGIPGIDVELGVRCSGSEDAYRTIMQIFYESIEPKRRELEEYYKAQDWENYTIRIHALKSSARLAGAMKLSDAAQRLEDAGKQKDTEYIHAHHEEVMRDLTAFIPFLEPVFGNTGTPDAGPEQENNAPRIDLSDDFYRDMIVTLYEVIKNGALNRDEAVIGQALREIGDYQLPQEVSSVIADLGILFAARDYSGMAAMIDERGHV